MLKKYAASFYHVGTILGIYHSLFDEPTHASLQAVLGANVQDKTAFAVASSIVHILADRLQEIDLTFSLKAVRRLETMLESGSILGPPTAQQIADALGQIDQRVRDELAERVLFYVTPEKVIHYDAFRAGWEEAINTFDISSDVEEAEKCFVFDRFAASVYHAMRVAETGVVALGSHFTLQAHILERPWGDIVKAVQEEVRKLPHATAVEKHTQSTFAEIAEDLFQVNLAWRIPAAHATRKPASKYTPDEAADVLSRTKALMRHLADAL